MWWFNITDYVAVAPPALAKNTETFMESSLTLLGRAVDHVVEKKQHVSTGQGVGSRNRLGRYRKVRSPSEEHREEFAADK